MSIVAQMYEDMQPVLQSSRPSDAMRALQNLVRSLPDFARAHNDLGTLYYEAGEKEKARGHFERAVKLSPETPDFKKNLADFYYVKMSRAEDALRLYREVLQMRPNDVLTLMTAAHILVSLKRFDEACLHYRRVLDIEPWNHEAKENLGRLSRLAAAGKFRPVRNCGTSMSSNCWRREMLMPHEANCNNFWRFIPATHWPTTILACFAIKPVKRKKHFGITRRPADCSRITTRFRKTWRIFSTWSRAA